MASCSLLVFIQKIIFTVKKFTKIVANRAAVFGSDINQIVWQLGLCPRPYWGAYSLFQREGREGRKEGERREEWEKECAYRDDAPKPKS